VYNEDDDGPAWMHTHGLLRCSSIEWEIMGVDREHASVLYHLINTVACASVGGSFPEADEYFELMYDVPSLWLPHEKALSKFPKSILGGLGDRDDWHTHPSGILMLKKKFLFFFNRYVSINAIAPMISDHPLMYISTEETVRMMSLARERFGDFKQHFAELGQNDDFMFTVKLGYVVDDADDDLEREHMWFKVRTLSADQVEGELLNQPYRIARMNEGDCGWHSLEHLTDWQIMSCIGTFSPTQLPNFEVELSKYRNLAEAEE
jgi:hypothetical protein